jgi:hypothetical protein
MKLLIMTFYLASYFTPPGFKYSLQTVSIYVPLLMSEIQCATLRVNL